VEPQCRPRKLGHIFPHECACCLARQFSRKFQRFHTLHPGILKQCVFTLLHSCKPNADVNDCVHSFCLPTEGASHLRALWLFLNRHGFFSAEPPPPLPFLRPHSFISSRCLSQIKTLKIRESKFGPALVSAMSIVHSTLCVCGLFGVRLCDAKCCKFEMTLQE
jgi:hypothetical protein